MDSNCSNGKYLNLCKMLQEEKVQYEIKALKIVNEWYGKAEIEQAKYKTYPEGYKTEEEAMEAVSYIVLKSLFPDSILRFKMTGTNDEGSSPSEMASQGDHNSSTNLSIVNGPLIPIIGKYMDVKIISVENPSHFICHAIKDCFTFQEMMQKMQEYYSNMQFVTNCKQVKTGNYYSVIDTDGIWKRALLQDILNVNPILVSVYFIDFGNSADIPLTSVLSLDDGFKKYPYAAIKAQSDHIKPVGECWTNEESEQFKKLVLNKELVAVVTNKELEMKISHNICLISVLLIDTNDRSKDIGIEEEMVSKGLAEWKYI